MELVDSAHGLVWNYMADALPNKVQIKIIDFFTLFINSDSNEIF